MSKNLSAALLIEKNRLVSDAPWLVFLDITLGSTVLYFVRNNEDITFGGHLYSAFPFELDVSKMTSKGDIPTLQLKVSNITRVIQPYLEQYSGGVDSEVKLTVANADNPLEDYTELVMYFDILGTVADESWVTFTLGMSNPLRRKFPNFTYIADHCGWKFDVVNSQSIECNYRNNLVTANIWQSNHSYNIGDRIYKVGDTSITFRCYVDGTSGGTEPIWTIIGGVINTDGTVEWVYDADCKRTLENCQYLGNSRRFGGFPGTGSDSFRVVF